MRSNPWRWVVVGTVLLLAACAHAPPRNPMAQWVPSPNHEARRPILIVLHATTQDSVAQSLNTLRTGNSGGRANSAMEIVEAILAICSMIHRQSPKTTIIVMSMVTMPAIGTFFPLTSAKPRLLRLRRMPSA